MIIMNKRLLIIGCAALICAQSTSPFWITRRWQTQAIAGMAMLSGGALSYGTTFGNSKVDNPHIRAGIGGGIGLMFGTAVYKFLDKYTYEAIFEDRIALFDALKPGLKRIEYLVVCKSADELFNKAMQLSKMTITSDKQQKDEFLKGFAMRLLQLYVSIVEEIAQPLAAFIQILPEQDTLSVAARKKLPEVIHTMKNLKTILDILKPHLPQELFQK
jgi:hypothetical protein